MNVCLLTAFVAVGLAACSAAPSPTAQPPNVPSTVDAAAALATYDSIISSNKRDLVATLEASAPATIPAERPFPMERAAILEGLRQARLGECIDEPGGAVCSNGTEILESTYVIVLDEAGGEARELNLAFDEASDQEVALTASAVAATLLADGGAQVLARQWLSAPGNLSNDQTTIDGIVISTMHDLDGYTIRYVAAP